MTTINPQLGANWNLNQPQSIVPAYPNNSLKLGYFNLCSGAPNTNPVTNANLTNPTNQVSSLVLILGTSRTIDSKTRRRYQRWKDHSDYKTYSRFRKYLAWLHHCHHRLQKHGLTSSINSFSNPVNPAPLIPQTTTSPNPSTNTSTTPLAQLSRNFREYYSWKRSNWNPHYNDNYYRDDYNSWRRAYDDDDLHYWNSRESWHSDKKDYQRKHRNYQEIDAGTGYDDQMMGPVNPPLGYNGQWNGQGGQWNGQGGQWNGQGGQVGQWNGQGGQWNGQGGQWNGQGGQWNGQGDQWNGQAGPWNGQGGQAGQWNGQGGQAGQWNGQAGQWNGQAGQWNGQAGQWTNQPGQVQLIQVQGPGYSNYPQAMVEDKAYANFKNKASLNDYCKLRRYTDWQDFATLQGHNIHDKSAYNNWKKTHNKDYNHRQIFQNEYQNWKNGNDVNAYTNWSNWQIWKHGGRGAAKRVKCAKSNQSSVSSCPSESSESSCPSESSVSSCPSESSVSSCPSESSESSCPGKSSQSSKGFSWVRNRNWIGKSTGCSCGCGFRCRCEAGCSCGCKNNFGQYRRGPEHQYRREKQY
jgi:hypothetical protein